MAGSKVRLTKGRVEGFTCPPERSQAFLWDTEAPGLGVRVTSAGARAYIYQGKLHGKAMRMTVGPVGSWGIDEARTEARRLRTLIDQGNDPREVAQAKQDARKAEQAARVRRSVTFGEAWAAYVEARAADWSDHHTRAHRVAVQKPGLPRPRSSELTAPGPLWGLHELPLADLTRERLLAVIEREKARRPTSTALAFRLVRAFLHWAAEHEDFSGLCDPAAVLSKSVRRAVPKSRAKASDTLQREQLPSWFAAVRALPDPATSAYLQALTLTGARAGELIGLRWDQVDFQWRSLVIGDKVEGERIIPLTPYVAALLQGLPKIGPHVFASVIKEGAPITRPHHAHNRALMAAGLPHTTLHGLRRTFANMAEWVELPAGVVAQIQGHKPTAIAEKHYRDRPLDLLRIWADKLEGWILSEAGIAIDGRASLRLVK